MTPSEKRLLKPELLSLIEDYLKAWNDHDIDAIVGFLTEDVMLTDPLVPEPMHGKEAFRKYLVDLYRLLPDFLLPVDDTRIFLADDHSTAVLTWILEGTFSGSSSSPPGASRSVRARGVDLYTLRGGLISEHVIIYDGLDFNRQLGLLESGT